MQSVREEGRPAGIAPAGLVAVQLDWNLSLSGEEYVSTQAWRWGTTSVGTLCAAAGIIAFLVLRLLGAGAQPDTNRVGPAAARSGVKDSETGWGITDISG